MHRHTQQETIIEQAYTDSKGYAPIYVERPYLGKDEHSQPKKWYQKNLYAADSSTYLYNIGSRRSLSLAAYSSLHISFVRSLR